MNVPAGLGRFQRPTILALSVNMKKTTQKLSESKFFLDKMKESYMKHDEFDYYFSAFISACRSVLWVLKAECKKNEEWLAWYEAKEPTKEEALFLKQSNEMRVRSEKHTPLKPDLMSTMVLDPTNLSPEVMELIRNGEIDKLDIQFHTSEEDVPEDRVYVPIVASEEYKQVNEFEGEDVLSVCEKYYQLVHGVVSESSANFTFNK